MASATSTIDGTVHESIEETATNTSLMKRLFGLAIIVAFIGWLDTSFLAGIHYAVLPLPEGAPIAGTGWEVLSSDWSYLFGIPTALYGAGYYLTVIAIGLLWYTTRLPQIERVFLPLSVVGISASVVFVYLQLFVIEAICPFCMISAGTTTLLFIISAAIYFTSEAPTIRELGSDGIDRSSLIWPLAFVAANLIVLGMIHVAAVAPLPVPGA